MFLTSWKRLLGATPSPDVSFDEGRHAHDESVGRANDGDAMLYGRADNKLIDEMCQHGLTKVATNAEWWFTLFVDSDGDHWLLDYPHTEQQGGGPRRLRRVRLSDVEVFFPEVDRKASSGLDSPTLTLPVLRAYLQLTMHAPNLYDLDGRDLPGRYGITQEHDGWIVYFGAGGVRSDVARFGSEQAACKDLLRRLGPEPLNRNG